MDWRAMTPAAMLPGVPYIVTKGSAWAELRRGDRVQWVRDPSVLWSSAGEYGVLQVTRKDIYYMHGLTRNPGSWEVEIDRAGIMERVAVLRKQADKLEGLL
jgi:hypothetical protein